jgi:hypothetical protein
MDVRKARPPDAPLAFALAIDEASHLVFDANWPAASSALRTLGRSVVPLAVPGSAWIAQEGENVALLEAEPRKYVIGWDITRLAVRGDVDVVVGPVVHAATKYLQERGVPRLFARCRELGSEQLRGLGFVALTREYVLLGPSGGSADALLAESRYRMPQDAWPLHQLESQVTPALVRQLEGLTSQDWSEHSKDMSEVVVERDEHIVGWVGWSRSSRRGMCRLGLLVHPDHRDLASDLLRQAQTQAPTGCRLVARVREYQIDTLNAFLEAGFEIAAEDILMVKHAMVEMAWGGKKRMKVAPIPSIQGFRIQLGPHRPAVGPRCLNNFYKEVST